MCNRKILLITILFVIKVIILKITTRYFWSLNLTFPSHSDFQVAYISSCKITKESELKNECIIEEAGVSFKREPRTSVFYYAMARTFQSR